MSSVFLNFFKKIFSDGLKGCSGSAAGTVPGLGFTVVIYKVFRVGYCWGCGRTWLVICNVACCRVGLCILYTILYRVVHWAVCA